MSDSRGSGAHGDVDHLDESSILEILGGVLPASSLRKVGEHLRVCPACERLLRDRAAEAERWRARSIPTSVRLGGGGSAIREPGQRLRLRLPAVPRSRRWVPGVAALFVAAAVTAVVLLPRFQQSGRIEPYYLSAGSVPLVTRDGGATASDARVHRGIEAYHLHDMEAAVELLREAQAQDGLEDLRRLYLAAALYSSGDPRDAARTLETLDVETLPQPWKDEARWLQVLSLEAAGSGGDALPILERLARSEGEIGARARARLRDREATRPR